MPTTIADLEEKQLENHLIAGGFLVVFTDILGNAQPAPTFQAFELNTVDLDVRERVVMIRDVGGINNPANRTLNKIRNMVVVVVGQTNEADRIVIRGMAEDLEKYLVANPTDGVCIFNIVSSGVSGPFTLEDSRRIYEINLQVSFNIVQPVF
jgi:hypothetical protein